MEKYTPYGSFVILSYKLTSQFFFIHSSNNFNNIEQPIVIQQIRNIKISINYTIMYSSKTVIF